MTKKTFTKTFTFALFYSLIWLMSSWLFTSTIDFKQYLASCLIASIVYYLLESRTSEVVEIERVVATQPEVEEVAVKTTRQYNHKDTKDSKDKKDSSDKAKKKAGRKPKKVVNNAVETTPAVIEAGTAPADETIDDVVYDPAVNAKEAV